MPRDTPRYRRYRGGSKNESGSRKDPLQEIRDLRRTDAAGGGAPATGRPKGGAPDAKPPKPPKAPRARRPWKRRVVKWVFVGALGWMLLSAVVFLVSAQVHQANIKADGGSVLGGGGTPPVGTSTVLVIGSDKRPDDSQEPGASSSGYGLADSIMLLRLGGGKSTKLSIARDTRVPIEGHGVERINSAYAYGGPALLVKTIEDYTGIEINHVMQISFSDFPGLIDSMGGVTYKWSCVSAKVNGGYKNGGVTLRIANGKRTHLNGKQALALSRVRKNDCNDSENDLTRARRQQKVLSSMKRRVLSPIGFARAPLIAWEAPKTMDSDMAGPRLIATMSGLALSGSSKTRVLGTISGFVPDEMKAREVDRFLAG